MFARDTGYQQEKEGYIKLGNDNMETKARKVATKDATQVTEGVYAG